MYFFTSDEHYQHANIIKYCNRPFENVFEMDKELIRRHNEVVKDNDIVVHAGDFMMGNKAFAAKYIDQLKGSHIFIKGSHDRWLKDAPQIWEKSIEHTHIVVCHYSMRVWPKSHYGSWQLYGHSHGGLEPIGKQWDIGVDNNNFYPVSFEQLKEIMKSRPDSFNLIKERRQE